MYNFLLTIHVSACLLLIFVVLLQTGRGAGMMIFGGGGGDSLINTPTGSAFMKKFTAVLAGTFAFTSLFLTLLSNRAGMNSVTSRVRAQAPLAAPAPVPAPPAAPAPAEPRPK